MLGEEKVWLTLSKGTRIIILLPMLSVLKESMVYKASVWVFTPYQGCWASAMMTCNSVRWNQFHGDFTHNINWNPSKTTDHNNILNRCWLCMVDAYAYNCVNIPLLLFYIILTCFLIPLYCVLFAFLFVSLFAHLAHSCICMCRKIIRHGLHWNQSNERSWSNLWIFQGAEVLQMQHWLRMEMPEAWSWPSEDSRQRSSQMSP